MTEYGRGPGSEPWHPEDPLYGDGGWGGQQPSGGQSTYGGQGQYHPQQPQQHAQYEDWSTGQQQGYGQQQYGGPAGQQQYNGGPEQQYDGAPQQQYNGGPDQYDGGYDTGGHGQVPYAADPSDPYANQPGGYGAESSPDYYGTPDAYPPPEPPSRRRGAPEPQQDWDPGPDQGEHAFFSGADDDEDDYDDGPPGRRGDRRGGRGGKKPKKRRSGCACLVVTLVFAGGLGGVGYFGYQFYQDRFGTSPDYAGEGTGLATVDIPKGSGGYVIGQKLKDAGVVKSVDAFVSAQAQNPKGDSIQDGVYVLKKQMSAKSAVELMLSPKSRNNLIIPEGKRNSWVYKQIDTRLELDKGTTEGIAKKDWKSLGLPDWANSNKDIKDPLEGFLYPSSYPVAKGQKPETVLKKMVAQANQKYDELGLKSKAAQLNLKDPLQVLTVASLVQAEGKYKHDFDKVATVVYNRLKPGNTETYGLLDFDSTVNYAKAESTLETGTVDDLRKFNDPYNTYKIKGLPPGPIGNPGDEALKSALNPAKGNWYYFVSINADETLFAETNEQHERNRQKYLEEQKKNSG
ncbi:endolytic transglycosylase MltG [Streptomyces sp. NPDC057302]|uniref:endolytic transglycosylase MltG n=1 Tax=Streptomyces sp. NPDC057302 TaxID=3346094 RepID=UPI0036428EF9